MFGWLVGCRLKANCPLVRPGPIGGVPTVGVFLRDPNSYLPSFGDYHGKLRTARSTSATGNRTRHLPSISFESRTAPLLVGPILLQIKNVW